MPGEHIGSPDRHREPAAGTTLGHVPAGCQSAAVEVCARHGGGWATRRPSRLPASGRFVRGSTFRKSPADLGNDAGAEDLDSLQHLAMFDDPYAWFQQDAVEAQDERPGSRSMASPGGRSGAEACGCRHAARPSPRRHRCRRHLQTDAYSDAEVAPARRAGGQDGLSDDARDARQDHTDYRATGPARRSAVSSSPRLPLSISAASGGSGDWQHEAGALSPAPQSSAQPGITSSATLPHLASAIMLRAMTSCWIWLVPS